MQALDIFPHDTFAREGVYSSLPYLVSHRANADSGLLWMTSAETFMDTYKNTVEGEGRLVDLASETGKMEFFLFGSAVPNMAPKRVAKTYSKIVGTQVLPPLFSLGFHYCKWEDETSAQRMMEWNDNFSAS